MVDTIDSIVKGAPQPEQEAKPAPTGTSPIGAATKPGDPLSNTPSSPSMIYLNMLILEASLRAQFLELRARRRKHTFFLSLLCLWLAGFGYALFFAPREDGRGVGGSVYWVVDMAEKVCFMGGIFTALLIWATGIWERGIRWPRRWFGVTNRGLRGFNCKLVAIKRSWPVELFSTLAFFFTYGAFSSTAGQYRWVEPSVLREVEKEMNINRQEHPALPVVTGGDEEKGGHEEDLAPSGDYVKLLLLPKPFSPTFRENWEIFRTEYWELENERRALLRARIKVRDQQRPSPPRGWLWWLPGRRHHRRGPSAAEGDRLGHLHPHTHTHAQAHHPRVSAVSRETRRSRSGSVRRGSTSAGSSRSPTPPVEAGAATAEDSGSGVGGVGGVSMSRKGSSASNSEKRRKKHLSSGSVSGTRSKRPGVDTRSLTPEYTSPLARGSSAGGEEAASSK